MNFGKRTGRKRKLQIKETTTNLDFRSLYLHFECGVWMYNSKAVLQIKKDYFDTLNECTQITLEECIERLPIRVFQEILRIFAPLM